ncbi:hypothetical protein [Treponema berlinense]|uniref:hypothetical protein n=1 Tax=Treponema berlinense TaxID=225004 RepID=UPI0026EBC586|nr:hypothetical protein [Treponema berlinense]
MKKIISALTLGAMVAGAAFADVGLALNYRQRATLLSHTNESKSNGIEETSAIFNTDAYSGNGTDNLTIDLGGDIASFKVVVVADEATTAKLRTKTLGGDLQLGKVGLFAGFWSDGKVKGAYRNKNDIDAGNMEGMDFEFKKLGSAYAGSPSFFVDNIVMPVQVTASESYAIGATYNIRNFKACKLELNGVYISNETSDEKSSKGDGSLQGHSLVGLVEANTAYGTGEFVFKYGQANSKTEDGNYADAMAFGAYLQPKIMNNLTTTIGAAGSVIDGDFTDWSADLRLYYKAGALSFTSFHSYSAILDAEENAAKLNGKKNAATKGIATNTVLGKDMGHKGTAPSRDAILTNNLMVRYKVNKSFAVYGVVADMIGLGENCGAKLKDKDGKETTDPLIQLRASAWAQFFAGSNSISVGLVYENYDVAETYGDSVQNIAIPMVFRVKM